MCTTAQVCVCEQQFLKVLIFFIGLFQFPVHNKVGSYVVINDEI